jgi:hypothetical protein
MSTPTPAALSPEPHVESLPSLWRIRAGLIMTLFGMIIFLVGARPGVFHVDRSPVVGFVQIAVFLVGLAIMCLGGYTSLMAFCKNGNRTIPADIGTRLVTTGYVIAVFSGMADVFGFGTQMWPRVPFFGRWQAAGVQIGEAVIAIGFLLLLPFRWKKKTQSIRQETPQ